MISLAKSSSSLSGAWLAALDAVGFSVFDLALVDALKNAFRMSLLGSGASSASRLEVLSRVRWRRVGLALLLLSFF
jgi:hypothetical protein